MTATQTITPRATPKAAPSSRSNQESPTAFIMAPTSQLTNNPSTMTAATINKNPHRLAVSRDPTQGRTASPAMR